MQFSEEDLRARFARESTVALLKMLAHGGEYEESALDIARQEMAKRPAPTHDEMFCDRSSPHLYSLWYGCVLKELLQLSPETAPSVRIVGVDEIELTMKDFVPAMESVTTYRTCWADSCLVLLIPNRHR